MPGGTVELSVIVPCLNEELNLPELCERVLAVFERGEILGELVLVDDGSRDDTARVIRDLAALHPGRVVGVYHPENRGIAAAWRSGCAAARGRLVATIDADLQYQPEDLLRLRRELLETSVDVVQGWRSAVGRRKDQRYTLSRGFNVLLNGVFGMSLQDNKSGFLMCAREVFQDLLSYRGSYFYWQSFVMVAAHAKGYSYKEIETLFEQRKQGVSFLEKTAISASVKSVYDLTKAAWEYRVKPPPPDLATQFLRRYPVTDRSPERNPLQVLRWRTYMASFNRTHWILTREVEHYYESLRKTQWLTLSQMRELQDEKLRRLVRHAYRNVPYYRAQMQARHIRPEDIRGQGDLHKLPLVGKGDVRDHLYFDIMSENHDKSQVLKLATSGATGEPFVCYADRAQLEFRWAAALRAQEWTGYRFGDPTVRLWHPQKTGSAELAREQADAVLCNRTLVPTLPLQDQRLADLAKTLRLVNPVLLDGYAETLDLVARYLQRRGEPLAVRPRAVLSGGQTLTDESRRTMEEAFGCRVFDEYGSVEFSTIAHECEMRTGHHVVAEGYIVEVLAGGRPAAPGEAGEVVVTDLNNYCMPFIRYRIGDRAIAMGNDPCTCGRGAPRIRAIDGRPQSVIEGADGRYLPGSFFAQYLKDFDYAIKRFQVVQDGPGSIVFRVVKGMRFSNEVLEEILSTFRTYIGEATRIEVELVDEAALVQADPAAATISARQSPDA